MFAHRVRICYFKMIFQAVFYYLAAILIYFDIVPDKNGLLIARGIVEYYKDNTRIEKFYFRVLPEPKTIANEEDVFYFGTGSRLKFCGSSSGPLYKIGVNTWADQSGAETYKTNINKENL